MNSSRHIFKLVSSLEEDRPWIDFELPQNARQNWGLVNEVLEGALLPSEPLPLNAVVNSAEALEWDYYGILNIMSDRARVILAPFAAQHFTFVQLTLNDEPYYLLKPTVPLRCLDTAQSVATKYRHDPTRIKEIKGFCFRKELIADPLVFWIPESNTFTLCTESILEIVDRAGLRGLRFDDLERPDGYVHPHAVKGV